MTIIIIDTDTGCQGGPLIVTGLNAPAGENRHLGFSNEFARTSMWAVDAHADASAIDAMLALNNAYPDELAVIDRAAMVRLVWMSFRTRRIGSIDAFVIALDQTASYDSPNFGWFRARCDRFVYVDRIVVDPAARGRGYARALYGDLFAAARAAGQERIVCEITARPPNPVSDAFHAALGFRAVGTAEILGGKKTVRYLERDLDDH